MIHTRKLAAILEVKTKALLDKNAVSAPFMILGLTLLLRVAYKAMMDGKEMSPELFATVLNLGLTMNITMTGMFVTSAALAQEKEKHTLRALMTSSVSGLEFFLGSIIPPFLEIMVINVLLLPVSGIDVSAIHMGLYLSATAIASLTSCIIGMLVGIYAKDQMAASTLTSPIMLILLLVPSFSAMLPALEKFSTFLFTGVLSDMVTSYATKSSFAIKPLHVCVLLGEILIALGLFLVCYRKNGYDKA